ncbi:NAD(P)/FAD-dependent oxidoreductase [Cyclobacterium jeungdonense]|uniref:FAD-binding oxidoreductase n=1 Tax=Cyclobacterium jeungdonense TaxID=708087 RepID=A0ABT8C716_9BACT|nr:FAD-binding oxidoreductase [Cyclobacterium jeungdonense]MDN3688301.1 FAD-binding oxidoreductase [Cyclobacterium jeungdonense]
MEVDFLLIGQGLAGSILSYRLIKAGFKVCLVDDGSPTSSSKVAAGLYNPITGRKMVKTWQADILFDEIETFYKELEIVLNQNFLHPTGIYRPFISYEEQNEWVAKSADAQYDRYIGEVFREPGFPGVSDPFGGLLLKSSGYLDIKKMLQAYRSWLMNRGDLIQSRFSEEKLIEEASGNWQFQEIHAPKLIFCNGIGAKESAFFKWVPFTPVKGEILTVRQEFTSREIINRGVFRIDLGNGIAKVGSTYNNREIDLTPTISGKREILDKLRQLVPIEVTGIVDHQVGIRPAMGDRRPVLGRHPTKANVYLFGGLGAKGVSLAPYFSKEMTEYLISGKEPQKEVNINRFFKYI